MAKNSFGPTLSAVSRVYAGAGAERTNPFHVQSSNAGDCMNPKVIVAWGHAFTKPSGVVETSGTLDLEVRCRKCENCLRANAHHWAFRAVREIADAGRTWFITFTLTPENHIRLIATGDPDKAAFQLVQKWLKSVRKAGFSVRYVLATEHHKNGFPHFHMLLHEKEGSAPLTNRRISGNQKEGLAPEWWPHGLIHCRLVKTTGRLWDCAFYVAKYIGKDAQARVRASQKYGGGRGGAFLMPPLPKKYH